MAENVVTFLLQNLSQLLASEAKLLWGVEDSVRSLHSELKLINAFLESSEGKKINNKKIEQEVVNQIRDVAHEAEDVIDTFIANVAIHKRRSMLGRMLHGVDHAKLLHDAANKIDNIKTTINEIRDNKIKYDSLKESTESATREDEDQRAQLLHKRRRNVEEDQVVGFVHDSEVVTKRLEEGGSKRNIVSIIGMGGLGKTTLARKVYNSDQVKKFFDCYAWVYVSNDFRSRELLLGLLKCLMPKAESVFRSNNKKKGKKHKGTENPRELSSLSLDELKNMVRDHLKTIRYLVVLDDLWKTQDWDEVQDAFPDDNNGSRILITSRLKEVALHASQDPPYYLQLLSEEESWELFSNKVFRGEDCPSDLELLGKQIVKSCRGLPLSILVLGGLLANKEKSHREWSKVVGHVNWYLTQDETQVKDILKLSYDDLPRRLKPCFLYLGIFPEDYEIHVRQLLQIWVAEGFIQQTGTRYPEDVAEDYLCELIDRSLIQVARVKTSGGVKACRIHDLLRDLCISESKEDKFLDVCTDKDTTIPTKPRRLSIQCSMPRYVSSSNNDHSCVRSLFCFDSEWHSLTSSEGKGLVKSFKLVRVLDLWSHMMGKIPSNLGVLIHLRYLRIDSEFIGRTIPASICRLQNLQTFDMKPSTNRVLFYFPCEMLKLKQLRHIYTCGVIKLYGHRAGSDDEVMWNLQSINSIVLNRQTASLMKKGRFPKLRKLGLTVFSNRKRELRDQLQSLQQLSHLNKLEIIFDRGSTHDYEDEKMETQFGCKPQELLQSLQPLSHLNALKIRNAMDLLTCPGAFPPHITELTLTYMKCVNSDGMNALGNLTKLRILRLSGGYGSTPGFELNCVAGSFPQLQVFQMTRLDVHDWKLANGAMPCLQRLLINHCRRLDGLPSELWSLTALRQVKVVGPSDAMALMLGNLEMNYGCELIIDDATDFYFRLGQSEKEDPVPVPHMNRIMFQVVDLILS